MITGYIVRTGESSPEKYINEVIKEAKFEKMNVICLHNTDIHHTFEVQNEKFVRDALNDKESNIETLLQKYIEYRTPIIEEDIRKAQEVESKYIGEA